MQQIRTVWAGLNMQKRVIVAFASLAMFAGVLILSRMAAAPSMTLLYAGLENGAAGEVVHALEQRNVVYEVRGGSIYVSAQQRDELRLTLASDGLPSGGGQGYELLDSLSGFGTTSQMFDAAYWRAKEGELARTIMAGQHVGQARVHIANAGSNPFQRSFEPSASVSVVPSGPPITPPQANAIRHLIASAVSGLTSENVSIIDANGTLISTTDTGPTSSTVDDRALQIRERVLRLVEARVGRGNAVVEVSLDTVTESESIRERRFDPNGRVAISTDVEERSDASSRQSGDVTVASNLPDGDAAEEDGSNSKTSSTRERVSYEVSETETEILRAPGAIKRLTVAVLINGIPAQSDGESADFTQRPAAELDALRELVESAVGYDPERGDVITLKSMDLPSAEPLGTSGAVPWLQRISLDVMSLLQLAALGIVTLLLGLFVVRPILTAPPVLANAAAPGLPGPANIGGQVLTGEIQDAETGRFEKMNMGDQTSASSLPGTTPNTQDTVDRLRAIVGDRQDETVEILRGWLEESRENA
ncbi:flagellar basal-body MS-ring/collar protein FliF [Falsiphaeobacter marinintestinus]|uniref:flagellar basal-body MS-ring/collar protein FliF n=1 Tax=Falsiphaeobacter marinintestinus TaxID=1492905 RepID=UPI0011B450CD|nr:flagellar basal-body MS-ring/collar protein FliF [Phaeobacter marinintestinus]